MKKKKTSPYKSFIKSLRKDPEMQQAYVSNIAMSFKDNFNKNSSLHDNANNSARIFIDLLIKKR